MDFTRQIDSPFKSKPRLQQEAQNSSIKLIGTLAVEKGWVTNEEVQQAVARQKTGKFFGEILLSRNLITVEQLDQLLQLQQESEIRPEDFLFGELAVQNKFVKAQDIVNALDFQKNQKLRKGLGEILVEAKLLSPQQCQAILTSQKRLSKSLLPEKKTVACPKCNTMFQFSDPERLRKVRCKKCRYVFEVGNNNVKVVVEPFQNISKHIGEIEPHSSKSLAQYLKENQITPSSNISESSTFFPKENERYILGNEIARGGMGSILMTRDVNLRRNIVTKILLNKKSRIATLRFIEEAQITGQLEHPNIPPVYDLGLNKDHNIFFTMKHIKGITLEDIIVRMSKNDHRIIEQYDYSTLSGIFVKLCNALDFAHSKNVIHRDIKPDNIMIGEYGEVLLMDWGLAKIIGTKEEVEELDEEKVSSVRSEDESSNTIEGTTAGTPAFMSPEQATGQLEDLDQRSDIYSLGATLFSILALERPVKGKNVQELLKHAAEGRIVEIKRQIPPELKAIALKAMAYHKEDRYQTIKEMEQDFIYYQLGYSVSAKQDNALDIIRKIYQRNRLLSIVSAIFIFSFLSISIFFIASLRNQRNNALSQKQLADEARTRADDSLKKAEVAIAQFEKEKRERMVDNKNAAPTYFAKAKQEAQLGKFAEAEKLMDTAINYDNANLDYHLYRGCLAIANNNLEKAITDLSVIKNNPNQLLAESLIATINKNPGKPLNENQKSAIADTCNALKFFDISQKMITDVAKKIEVWNKKILDGWGKSNFSLQMTNNKLVFRTANHTFPLDFNLLKGIPINVFIVQSCANFNNISFLEGMNLEEVTIYGCPLVTDISSLKGAKLKLLHLEGCGVKDLSPISSAELNYLTIRACPITTLKPILHMPLKELDIFDFKITEPNEIKSLALEKLSINLAPMQDCEFINTQNLKHIAINSTRIKDISKLKNAPLEHFECTSYTLSDISPLANKNIKYLILNGTKVDDINILVTMKNLETLVIGPNLLKPGWESTIEKMKFQLKKVGLYRDQLMPTDKFLEQWRGYNINNPKK